MASSSSNTLLKAAGALVVLFVAIWLVLAIVGAIVSLVQWVLSLLLTLAVLGLIGYGIYWMAAKLLTDDDAQTTLDSSSFDVGSGTTSRSSTESQGLSDPVDKLREQYASGQISEAEFERKLERELGTRSLEKEVGMREDEDLERN